MAPCVLRQMGCDGHRHRLGMCEFNDQENIWQFTSMSERASSRTKAAPANGSNLSCASLPGFSMKPISSSR